MTCWKWDRQTLARWRKKGRAPSRRTHRPFGGAGRGPPIAGFPRKLRALLVAYACLSRAGHTLPFHVLLTCSSLCAEQIWRDRTVTRIRAASHGVYRGKKKKRALDCPCYEHVLADCCMLYHIMGLSRGAALSGDTSPWFSTHLGIAGSVFRLCSAIEAASPCLFPTAGGS
jgi:hypothetical protein